MQTLNPALYEVLCNRFGRVGVIHRGEIREIEFVPDRRRGSRLVNRSAKYGEQYSLNCPFCHDTRQRLLVGYEFGTMDPTGRRLRNYPMHCFNERCHKNAMYRNILLNIVTRPQSSRAREPVPPASAGPTNATPEPLPITVPDNMLPLNQLPATHPANRYLNCRGFDPYEIDSVWRVCYCSYASNCRPLLRNRIVVPVFSPVLSFSTTQSASESKMCGWQARAIDGGGASEPKYLTMAGMEKSKLLYGLAQALPTTGPVLIVEGVTDVWRIGPGAVALFGKSLSDYQKALIVHRFAGRPLVVLLDRDARDEALEIQHKLQLACGLSAGDRRVVIAAIPDGRSDPGDSTREDLIAVTVAALSQNVSLVTQ